MARYLASRRPAKPGWMVQAARLRKMTNLLVELSTPSGPVFSASASAIDVHTEDGSIHITPREESYLSMIHATQITLHTADGPCIFLLENAVAGLKGQTFTVLAENIRRVEPEALAEPLP